MPILLSRPNSKGRRDLLIILGPDNIERIQEKDPFELKCYEFPWKEPIGVIQITCVNDDELKEIEELARDGKTMEAIRLATSGFKYRPEKGDHDRGFERLA